MSGVLSIEDNQLSYTSNYQYSFVFVTNELKDEFSNVVGFVPRSRSIALAYFAFDFFANLGKEAQRSCRRLQRHGYYYLGDVISLSEVEIVTIGAASPALVSEMSGTLAQIDLRFGTRTPLWRVRRQPALAR